MALIISGVSGAIISGIFVAKTKKFKITIIVCNIMGLLSMLSFMGSLYLKKISLSILSTVFYGFFSLPLYPLNYELASEIYFPIGES